MQHSVFNAFCVFRDIRSTVTVWWNYTIIFLYHP